MVIYLKYDYNCYIKYKNKLSSYTIMFKVQNKNEFIQNYQGGIRDFQHTILTAVNLTGTNLEEINLDESNLIEINWSNCSLNRASFKKAYLGLSNFQNCCLKSANLQEANLQEANLSQADLAGADLQGANLQQANLKGANFTGAKLDQACFTQAIYDSQTVFDPNFDPQTAGMILDSINSHQTQIKNNFQSKSNKGATKKLFSWGFVH
jgi:uncharacterized protein YjbI with pentapeptide repeats